MLRPEDLQRSRMTNGHPTKTYAIGFLELKPEEICWGVFTSRKIEWFDVHWFRGKHVICTKPKGFCSACNECIPALPRGYAAVMREGQLGQLILKLTPRMVKEEPVLAMKSWLRGSRFKLWRPGKHEEVKTCIRIEGVFPEENKLPAELDIVKAICRVFGSGSEPSARSPEMKEGEQ